MVYGGAWLGKAQIIQANVSQDVDKVEKIHKWQIRQIDQPPNITRGTHTPKLNGSLTTKGLARRWRTMGKALVVRILERH